MDSHVEVAQKTQLYLCPCPECGIEFGISHCFEKRRREDGRTFYCPNGHRMSWGDSETSKLRNQLAQTSRKLEYLEADHAKAQEKIVSLERSECPACKQVIKNCNMARHIRAQHKEPK